MHEMEKGGNTRGCGEGGDGDGDDMEMEMEMEMEMHQGIPNIWGCGQLVESASMS